MTFAPLPGRPDTAGWSQLARSLLMFWDGRRRGRAMPSRADVEPAEMKPWLSRVMLIDVIDGGRDFRYRLVGTDIASRLGFDATGTNLSALPQAPEHVAKFLEEHQAVVRSVRPGYAVHDYYSTNINRLIRFERLLLPLGEHDDEVTMLLGLRNDLIERRPGDRP